jgi:hypothetical protein
MRRREFITLLGGAMAWPMAARAQQPTRIRRVGLLLNLSEDDLEAQRLVTAFREELAQLGGPMVAIFGSITAGQAGMSAASELSQTS